MFKNGVAMHRIAGFDELGSKDDSQTSVLERRLLKAGVIQKHVNRIDWMMTSQIKGLEMCEKQIMMLKMRIVILTKFALVSYSK